jgi:hypothetical protein
MVLVIRFGITSHDSEAKLKRTYIMEPSRSLDAQIFSCLDKLAYRNLSASHNPLNIPEISHVDLSQPHIARLQWIQSRKFLVRRGEFTQRVLDM